MSNLPIPVESLRAGQLAVEVHNNRIALGKAAACAAAAALRALLKERAQARVVFACAPSQDEFLEAMTLASDIAWERITAFHMDEYVGLAGNHPASFRKYLRDHIGSRVCLGRVHELAGDAPDPKAECARYARLLSEAPIDLVFMGIGENGHIAFNDPPVARFDDPAAVKVVRLDKACRQQQVNDGCFPTLADVPKSALTLTVPTLMGASRLFCMVPGPRKARAVATTLQESISLSCPASILRIHPAAILFLDKDSASEIAPDKISS